MKNRPRWIPLGSGIIGVVVAALVVFVGLRAGFGDDTAPDDGATDEAATFTPPYGLVTIIPPQEHEGAFPVTVSIQGERVPYDPAALLERLRAAEEPRTWLVQYDDDPALGDGSTVQFDWDGRVMVQRILPWHAAVYEPLLSLAGATLQLRTDAAPPASPTAIPAPTPTVVTIRGVQVTLPAGASLSRPINEPACNPQEPCPSIEPGYLIRRGRSYISFTDEGIQGQRILPEDMSDFSETLRVMNSLSWDSSSPSD
jgi:hypothetical protein